LLHQVDVELADQRAGEFDVVLESRPAGEIDHRARQRLIERHVGVAEAAYAGLVAARPGERLPQRDADVLDRVMRVDVQVALSPAACPLRTSSRSSMESAAAWLSTLPVSACRTLSDGSVQCGRPGR